MPSGPIPTTAARRLARGTSTATANRATKTLIKDPLGHETRFTFDAQGRQLTRTLPLSQVEQFQYNDRGRQTLYVSFEGIVTESVFDNASGGRLIEKRFFDNLTQYNGGNGTPSEIVRYSLDEFGRTVRIIQDGDGNLSTTADQRVTDKAYDDVGRVVSVASPEGTIRYQYDEVTGRLTRTYTGYEDTTGVPASGDGVAVTDTSYAYDALGRIDTVTVTERFDVPLSVAEQVDYVYGLSGLLEEIHLPGDVITDYQFDELDRLDLVRTFRDTDGDDAYTAGVDALLAEFDYDVRADGKRTGVTETDDQGRTTRIDWDYDDIGRLIRESYNSFDDSLDFIADYVFDLTGNRREKKTDTDPTFTGSPTFDETVSYVFDANDRLLSETLDAPGTAEDRFTAYEYGPNAAGGYGGDHTTRTKKTVYQGLDASGTKLSEDGYTYTRQGRLWIAERDTDGDGTVDQTLKYEYNDNGVRVSSEVDGTKTLLLVDENNPTGYAQVLEELDSALSVIRSYTLGLDVLAQAESTGEVYYFLYDGHGSVRGLLDTSGLIVPGQVYRFDAYGSAIGFDPAAALTGLLYSGELYDSQLQLQYLRARWYDLSTGTFNRLDPFFGNLQDPQSLHKYAYVHGDPVQGVDPSGELLGLIGGLLGGMFARSQKNSADLSAYGTATGAARFLGFQANVRTLVYLALAGITITSELLRPLGLKYGRESANQLRVNRTLERLSEGLEPDLERELEDEMLPRRIAIRLGFIEHFDTRDNEIPVFLEKLSVLQSVAETDLRAQMRGYPLLLMRHGSAELKLKYRKEAQRRWRRENGFSGKRLPRSVFPDPSLEEYPFASTMQGGIDAYVELADRRSNSLQGTLLQIFYTTHAVVMGRPFLVLVVP